MAVPQVSVILPTWNRADLLSHAIASVRSQTFDSWELIVVDDGSTDDTAGVVAGFRDDRVSFLALPHSGNAARARNAALRIARAERVAFIDSDDEWLPDKLAIQLAALAKSGRRWGYTRFQLMDAEG